MKVYVLEEWDIIGVYSTLELALGHANAAMGLGPGQVEWTFEPGGLQGSNTWNVDGDNWWIREYELITPPLGASS